MPTSPRRAVATSDVAPPQPVDPGTPPGTDPGLPTPPEGGTAGRLTRAEGVLAVLLVAVVIVSTFWVIPGESEVEEPATGYRSAKAFGFAKLFSPEQAPLAGQPFSMRGKIATKAVRPVKLQALKGGRYRTIASTSSTAAGKFRFPSVTLKAGSYTLRVHAPQHMPDGRWQVLRPSRSKAIEHLRVSTASITATALPPVAAPINGSPGQAPTSPQVAARFEPARPGDVAVLEKKTPGSWVKVARMKQDQAGWAVFEAPAGDTYRVISSSAHGTKGTRKTRKQVRAAVTRSNAVTTSTWRVDFAEDFAGAGIDERYWIYEKSGYTPIGQRSCSTAHPSALQVSGGALRMGVRENPDRAGQVCHYPTTGGGVGQHPFMYNTQINTRGKYTFKYGFAAARMKLQRSRGMHSAFWLLPENWVLPPGNPAGGTEVDIVEWFGHNPKRSGLSVNSFIHYMDASGKRVKLGDSKAEGYRELVKKFNEQDKEWWNAYHVFSLEWTPKNYVFRVDGREFYRETRAMTHTPAYVSLSMLLGDYELDNLTPAGRKDAAMVDWIRVYQQ